jgi:hypothetical protein
MAILKEKRGAYKVLVGNSQGMGQLKDLCVGVGII